MKKTNMAPKRVVRCLGSPGVAHTGPPALLLGRSGAVGGLEETPCHVKLIKKGSGSPKVHGSRSFWNLRFHQAVLPLRITG